MMVIPVNGQLSLQAHNGGMFVASSPAWVHPKRVLNSHELIFVKEGTLSMWEDEQSFTVRAGETLLLRPEHAHGGVSPCGGPLCFYWVHFSLAPSKPSGDSLDLRQHVRALRPDHMTALFRRLIDDQELFGMRSLSLSLLVMLMACEVARSSTSTAEEGAAPSLLAAKAHLVIDTKFHERISSSSIASKLQCNVDYLGRVYRTVYGKTLTEALNERRIRHAVAQLGEPGSSVEEVALACGFTDTVYFRRIFKKLQGMTPSAHRSLYTRTHINHK